MFMVVCRLDRGRAPCRATAPFLSSAGQLTYDRQWLRVAHRNVNEESLAVRSNVFYCK